MTSEATATFNIQAGQTYRCRDGRSVRVIAVDCENPNIGHPVSCGDGRSRTLQGRLIFNTNDELDGDFVELLEDAPQRPLTTADAFPEVERAEQSQPAQQFNIQVGQTYRCRDGSVVTVTHLDGMSESYPFDCDDNDSRTPQGRVFDDPDYRGSGDFVELLSDVPAESSVPGPITVSTPETPSADYHQIPQIFADLASAPGTSEEVEDDGSPDSPDANIEDTPPIFDIRVGEIYRTRAGRSVQVTDYDSENFYPYLCDDGETRDDCGRVTTEEESVGDFVELIRGVRGSRVADPLIPAELTGATASTPSRIPGVPMTAGMSLEVGRYYRLRSGEIVQVDSVSDQSSYPYHCTDGTCRTSTGRVYDEDEDEDEDSEDIETLLPHFIEVEDATISLAVHEFYKTRDGVVVEVTGTSTSSMFPFMCSDDSLRTADGRWQFEGESSDDFAVRLVPGPGAEVTQPRLIPLTIQEGKRYILRNGTTVWVKEIESYPDAAATPDVADDHNYPVACSDNEFRTLDGRFYFQPSLAGDGKDIVGEAPDSSVVPQVVMGSGISVIDGHFYRQRNGRIVEVFARNLVCDYPFSCSGGATFSSSGRFNFYEYPTPFDLVEDLGESLEAGATATVAQGNAPELSLEVGKYYRQRNGLIVRIGQHYAGEERTYPFADSEDSLKCWTADGRFDTLRPQRPEDLIEEVSGPTPTGLASATTPASASHTYTIRVGGTYRLRNDMTVTITRNAGSQSTYPFQTQNGMGWSAGGQFLHYSSGHPYDIVGEVGVIPPAVVASLKQQAEKFHQLNTPIEVDPQLVLDLIAAMR